MFNRSTQLVLMMGIFSLSAAAWAQSPPNKSAPPPPAEPKPFISAKELAEILAKGDATHQAGQSMPNTALLRMASYTANLEYKTSVGTASTHEKEAELFVVIEGSGTLVLGGKLTNESRRDANNLTGTGIEGGTSKSVAKGDMFIVPENTAHWFSAIDGKLAVMTLHLPRVSNAP
jgi:hypothetical protein